MMPTQDRPNQTLVKEQIPKEPGKYVTIKPIFSVARPIMGPPNHYLYLERRPL